MRRRRCRHLRCSTSPPSAPARVHESHPTDTTLDGSLVDFSPIIAYHQNAGLDVHSPPYRPHSTDAHSPPQRPHSTEPRKFCTATVSNRQERRWPKCHADDRVLWMIHVRVIHDMPSHNTVRVMAVAWTCYRGTSLLRGTPHLGPHCRTIPRVIWWS